MSNGLMEREGYAKRDIWNLDETGVFWNHCPNMVLFKKVDFAKEERKVSKSLAYVAFIVNADGGKEKPVVIWKYENPRCFKNLNKNLLPVSYFSQFKAWMTWIEFLKRLIKV